MHWYIKVLKNYTEFEGRARRKEYWMFTLINVLIVVGFGVLTVILANNVIGEAAMKIVTVLYIIYALAIFIPSLAVTVRRLHDTGRSGWWILGNFIPIVNIIVFVFTLMDSQAGENEYGPNPKAAAI